MDYIDKRLVVSTGVAIVLLLLAIVLTKTPYNGIDLGEEYVLAEIKPIESQALPPLQMEVFGFQ